VLLLRISGLDRGGSFYIVKELSVASQILKKF